MRHGQRERASGAQPLKARGAIGVFDSGLGGLTVVRALRAAYPETELVYLGDTARVPYGTKHASTVLRYAEHCAWRLVDAGVSQLVVACNTASAWALGRLRDTLPVPVVGVLNASARAAAASASEGTTLVLATAGTVRSEAYRREMQALVPGAKVLTVAAPLLVSLAEEGWVEGDIPRRILRHYLADMQLQRVETIVLGCTHFPVFEPVIRELATELSGGRCPRIVSSADAVVAELARRRHLVDQPSPKGRLRVWLTDAPEHARPLIARFLGEALAEDAIEHIELSLDLRHPARQTAQPAAKLRPRRRATA